MLVYKIKNIANGKVYIGQTTRPNLLVRWKEHLWDARKGRKSSLLGAIRKYGADNFSVDSIYRARTFEELNRMETFFIILHQSHKSENGYNLTLGGDGVFPAYWQGKKRSPEDIEKMRQAKLGTKQDPEVVYRRTRVHVGNQYNKGRKQSEETVEKRIKPLRGKVKGPLPEEVRKKIGKSVGLLVQGEDNPFFGKIHSEVTRQAISKANTGRIPSPEELQKRSLALRGKKRTPETKRLMSEVARRRGVSREHILLMTAARLAKRKAAVNGN